MHYSIAYQLGKRSGALDPDAKAYIVAVETEDGQALESGVRKAINNFVVGCKGDGIWDAIKASCILAGARTLDGALVPLVGTAPTNNNFVSGDYNRETGLVGDGSTKYLDSNRANNADPQDDNHNAAYLSSVGTNVVMASFILSGGNSMSSGATRSRNVTSNARTITETGLYAINRSSSASYQVRTGSTNYTESRTSQTAESSNVAIFSLPNGSSYGNHRISFYSIGESLDLAALDTRVSRFMAEMPFAINTGLDPSSFDIDTLSYINAGYAAGGTLA